MKSQHRDDLLQYLYDNGQKSFFEIATFVKEVSSLRDTAAVLEGMVKKGYIVKRSAVETPTKDSIFSITDDGMIILENGGFVEIDSNLEREEAEAEERKRLEKEQIQSVIDTNDSVKITNAIQKKLGIASTIMALIATFFIFVSTWQQCSDPTDMRLQGIQEEMRNTKKSIDSIVLFQQRTDASIRRIADSIAR